MNYFSDLALVLRACGQKVSDYGNEVGVWKSEDELVKFGMDSHGRYYVRVAKKGMTRADVDKTALQFSNRDDAFKAFTAFIA